MDKKDLKIQALLEKISSLTTNYENTAADLRVELTVAIQEKEALTQVNAELMAELEAVRDSLEEKSTSHED